jgi:hypothetical protein
VIDHLSALGLVQDLVEVLDLTVAEDRNLMQELQTKEIKNARLAMVAFVGFIIQAQATGQVTGV